MLRALTSNHIHPFARLTCAVALVALAGCASGGAKKEGPASPREQVQAGIQAHQARDYDSAISAFKAVAERTDLEGDMAVTAWANLGASYDAASRYPEALAALEKARELAPDRPQTYFNLGRVYTNLGRFDDARDSYLKAGELDPANSNIPYNLGILYEIYLNQPDRALAAYRAYLKMGGPETSRVQGWIDAIERRGEAN